MPARPAPADADRVRKTMIVTLTAAALLTAGCSSSDGELLDSTESVCDDFAGYVRDGGDRAEVVASIGEVIDNAEAGVRDAYPTLQNTVDGNESAQQLADDTFAQSCFDAGWEG
jgi:hypothetical protein